MLPYAHTDTCTGAIRKHVLLKSWCQKNPRKERNFLTIPFNAKGLSPVLCHQAYDRGRAGERGREEPGASARAESRCQKCHQRTKLLKYFKVKERRDGSWETSQTINSPDANAYSLPTRFPASRSFPWKRLILRAADLVPNLAHLDYKPMPNINIANKHGCPW